MSKIKVKPGQRWLFSNTRRPGFSKGSFVLNIQSSSETFHNVKIIQISKGIWKLGYIYEENDSRFHQSNGKSSIYSLLKNQNAISEI